MPINIPNQVNTLKAPKTEQYYDQTTPAYQVFAKPIDMPIDQSELIKLQTKQSQSAAFWNSLSNLGVSVANLTQKISAETERKNLLAAQEFIAKGITPPQGTAKGVLDTYYKLLGNTDINNYSTGLMDYILSNAQNPYDPNEVQKLSNEFTAKWLEQRPANDAYMEGFLENAIKVQETIQDRLFQAGIEQKQIEIKTNIINTVYQTADNVFNQGVKQIIGVDLETLANDPTAWDSIPTIDFNNYLRGELSKIQDIGKQAGLTRLDISQLFIEQVGRKAVELGMPELLDFTALKDSSGIALENTVLKDTIEQYRAKALSVKQAKQEQYLKLQEEYNKNVLSTYRKRVFNTVDSLYELSKSNPLEAAKEAEKLKDELLAEDSLLWQLDDDDYNTVVRTLNDVVFNPKSHPEASDDAIYYDLTQKVIKGTLTAEDVYNNRDKLTKADFDQFLNKAVSMAKEQEQHMQSYIESELMTKGYLEGFDLDKAKAYFQSKLISPEAYQQYVQAALASQEEQDKANQVALKQTQEETYYSYLYALSTGALPIDDSTIAAIENDRKNGKLSTDLAYQLVDKINKKQEEALSEFTATFTNPGIKGLQQSILKQLSPELWVDVDGTVKREVTLELNRIYYDLEQNFRKQYGVNASYEDYKREVFDVMRNVLDSYVSGMEADMEALKNFRAGQQQQGSAVVQPQTTPEQPTQPTTAPATATPVTQPAATAPKTEPLSPGMQALSNRILAETNPENKPVAEYVEKTYTVMKDYITNVSRDAKMPDNQYFTFNGLRARLNTIFGDQVQADAAAMEITAQAIVDGIENSEVDLSDPRATAFLTNTLRSLNIPENVIYEAVQMQLNRRVREQEQILAEYGVPAEAAPLPQPKAPAMSVEEPISYNNVETQRKSLDEVVATIKSLPKRARTKKAIINELIKAGYDKVEAADLAEEIAKDLKINR